MGQQVSSNLPENQLNQNRRITQQGSINTNQNKDQNVIPNARSNQTNFNPNQQNAFSNPQQNPIPQRQPPKKNYKGTISTSDLKAHFHRHSIDGKYLNKDRFNDTIESIFSNINIPRLHYTHLSSKIYEFLDESKDSKISEEEFMTGMKNVLSNRDLRLKLSMSAMMIRSENRNSLEFNEIVDFFYKSWIQAYRHLGWNVKNDKANFQSKCIPIPTITQFELFATKFENNIRIYLQNDFRACGIDINSPIPYDVFIKWIYQDHTIYLNYSFKSVAIATSLIYLDDVEFNDNLNMSQQISNIPQTNVGVYPSMNYPSFA